MNKNIHVEIINMIEINRNYKSKNRKMNLSLSSLFIFYLKTHASLG